MAAKFLMGDRYDPFFRWLPLSEYVIYGWWTEDPRHPKVFWGAVDVPLNSELVLRYRSEMRQNGADSQFIAKTTPTGFHVVSNVPGGPYEATQYADPHEAIHVVDKRITRGVSRVSPLEYTANAEAFARIRAEVRGWRSERQD